MIPDPEEIATAQNHTPRDDTKPEDLDLKVYTTQITCHCEPRTFFRGVAVSPLIGILPAMGYVSVPEEIATAVKLPRDDTGPEDLDLNDYQSPNHMSLRATGAFPVAWQSPP